MQRKGGSETLTARNRPEMLGVQRLAGLLETASVDFRTSSPDGAGARRLHRTLVRKRI
jgi:hypothetical protein